MPENMLPIELIEVVFVALTLIVQVIMFLRTRAKIRLFRRVVPQEEAFEMVEAHIPITVLKQTDTKDIIENIKIYFPAYAAAKAKLEEPFATPDEVELSEPDTSTTEPIDEVETPLRAVPPLQINSPKEPLIEVPIIRVKGDKEAIFDKILLSINTYLLRNKGAVTDFNLVKDIVERNVEALDNDIRITLPIPLYLGLMMTMFGIVIGLFWMPDLTIDLNSVGDSAQFSDGINVLLGGVRVAMIASFTGLLLTTVNSGFLYNGSKLIVQDKKNNFYLFIQTKLMPVFFEKHTLNNIIREDFSQHLEKIVNLMEKNYESLKKQEELLPELMGSDFTQSLKSNIVIIDKVSRDIQQLEKSTAYLANFQSYLKEINHFTKTTNSLNNRIEDILNRTDNFKAIAFKVRENLDEATKFQQFFNSHFSELESRKQLISNTVAEVDDVLDKSLTELREHTQQNMKEIRDLSIKQHDLTETILRENSFQLKKFFSDLQVNMGDILQKNYTAFDQLGHLKDLSRNFSRFIEIEQKRSEEFNKIIKEIKNIHQNEKSSIFSKLREGVSYIYEILAIVFFIFIMIYTYVNGGF